MTGFVLGVALGYCAAALLPTGIAHLFRLPSFAALVAGHGLVTPRMAPVVAVGTGLAEVGIGASALVAIVTGGPGRPVLGAALLLGIAFVVYLAGLLRRPDTGLGCGCTPLSGPVTGTAVLPGAALAAVCALALLGVAVAPAAPAVFGAAWGATLAVAVLLVPASTPDPAVEPGRA